MKTWSLMCRALIIITLLIVAGCGDDCPTCVDFVQKAIMMGEIQLNEQQLQMEGYIVGINASLLDVDSIRVAGDLADLQIVYDDGAWGQEILYQGPEGDARFSSGDRVSVTIYTPFGICNTKPKVLDSETDAPNIINWKTEAPYDTVDIGADITVSWNRVANADWYRVHNFYQYDSLGWYDSKELEVYQTDTLVTFPNEWTAYDGWHQISIQASTGLAPGSGINRISGGVVKGWINSHSRKHFSIYVGSGGQYLKRNTKTLGD